MCMLVSMNENVGPTIITDNIVLGSRDDSQNTDLLFEYGITHILNVAAQLPNLYTQHFQYEKLNLHFEMGKWNDGDLR